MRRIILSISILCVIISCTDKDVLKVPGNIILQSSYDHIKAEQIFKHVNKIVEDAFLNMDQHMTHNQSKSTVTYKFDTININNISTPAIRINFSSSGTLLFNNKIMEGEIIAGYDGFFSDSLTTINISFLNYKVDGQLVQGDVTIKNKGMCENGNICFEMEVINGSVNTLNGTINWQTVRNIEWVEGKDTKFTRTDDKYKITGYSSGNGINGNDFQVEITDTLQMDLGCPTCLFKNGQAKISPEGYDNRIINYGDDTSICDCGVYITVDNEIYPIQIGG